MFALAAFRGLDKYGYLNRLNKSLHFISSIKKMSLMYSLETLKRRALKGSENSLCEMFGSAASRTTDKKSSLNSKYCKKAIIFE
jgi:hypothetical protein